MNLRFTLIIFLIFPFASTSHAQEFGFSGISNDLAIYRNANDHLRYKGWTLQLVLINTARIGTDFQIEVTADLNHNLAWQGKDDYYAEFGILKEFFHGFSVNYQRIEGTFQPGGINQLGLRYHF